MASWTEFAQQAPELAEFGKARFQSGVAYLGTLRPDGGPRVHPVTPFLGEQLFLFMEPTSPKGKDLQRDGRYTLHCSVNDSSGGEGEFYVRGRATMITDPVLRDTGCAGRTLSCARSLSRLYVLDRVRLYEPVRGWQSHPPHLESVRIAQSTHNVTL